MKKALLLFAGVIMMVFATSCTKKTTYEIYNGTSGIGVYDVKAYEYSGSILVNYSDVGFLNANATSGSIEASKDVNKVQVAFKFAPGGDVYTTAEYFTLKSGGHTMILLEDNTQIFGGNKGTTTVEKAVK
jgi:hypothetical protein